MTRMSKREVTKMARLVAKMVLGDTPGCCPYELDIRFVKNSPRRVLKQGFRRLVPEAWELDPATNQFKPRRIVLHIRHRDRETPFRSAMLIRLAHEFLHAKQVFKGDLVQNEDGSIRYHGEDYRFFYNVHYRVWTVVKKGSFQAIRQVPWERDLVDTQYQVMYRSLETLGFKEKVVA